MLEKCEINGGLEFWYLYINIKRIQRIKYCGIKLMGLFDQILWDQADGHFGKPV